jgi:hypothetical protein
MGRWLAWFVQAAILCAAVIRPQARHAPTPPTQPPSSWVDVVHVDVSVLDDQRHPVRNLTAADFTVPEIPVERLASGEYLLTIEVAQGDRVARRGLRFTMR